MRVATQQGYLAVGANIDPMDYSRPGGDTISRSGEINDRVAQAEGRRASRAERSRTTQGWRRSARKKLVEGGPFGFPVGVSPNTTNERPK